MKTKILIIGSIIFLCTVRSYCQDWVRIYADSLNTTIEVVKEHYDKGYVFSGAHFEGWSYYGFLLKTDINGEVLWKKSYGILEKRNQFHSLQITTDLGIILTGSSTNISTNCTDPLLIKVNTCGEKEWCKIYNAQGCNSWAKDIELTEDSGYLMLLDRWKSGEGQIIWLFKLDNLGEVIWAQVYATNPNFESEWSHSLLQTADSCFIITGEAYYPDPTYPNKWIIKIILIKVNLNGEAIFEVPWGANNGLYSKGFETIEENNHTLFTAGEHPRTTSPGGDSPCLFKTSESGEALSYHDLLSISIKGISTTINWFQDSTLVLGTKWGYSSGVDTIGVFKTNKSGTVLKARSLLTSLSGTLQSSAITFNNKVILSGSFYTSNSWKAYAFKLTSDLEYDSVYTTPFTYDSLCPHAITSDTIPLDDCEVVIVGIDDPVQNPEKTWLKVYPNPAENSVTVEMPTYLVKKTANGGQQTAGIGITATTYYHQWKSVRLDVFDLFGRLMYTAEIQKQNPKTEIDISSWPAGMYVARIVFMNDVVGVARFVKE